MGSLSKSSGLLLPRFGRGTLEDRLRTLEDSVYHLIRDDELPVRWDDERVPVSSTRLGGSKDPGYAVFKTNGAGSQGVFVYWFDDDAEEELYFSLQLPHTFALNTALEPHVHWIPAANGSAGQVVSWGLEYTWADIGQTFGDTAIISGNAHYPADASLVAGRHYLTDLGTIAATTTAGTVVSSMLVCRVFRDATGALKTDSYADDAGLLEIDFHIRKDTCRGSQLEAAKWDR